jgi:hypothetical protein
MPPWRWPLKQSPLADGDAKPNDLYCPPQVAKHAECRIAVAKGDDFLASELRRFA